MNARVIVMATGHTIGRIIAIGDHHPFIAINHRVIALHRFIAAAAMPMCAGALTAIVHIGPMTTLSSPIMVHAVNAIRHIYKQKSPGQPGLSYKKGFKDQVTKAPIDAATRPIAMAIITP